MSASCSCETSDPVVSATPLFEEKPYTEPSSYWNFAVPSALFAIALFLPRSCFHVKLSHSYIRRKWMNDDDHMRCYVVGRSTALVRKIVALYVVHLADDASNAPLPGRPLHGSPCTTPKSRTPKMPVSGGQCPRCHRLCLTWGRTLGCCRDFAR